MKEKVLISRKRLCELENIELNYKMMENAVNVAQERSKKLAVRNMELIRDFDRTRTELTYIRNQLETISNHKAMKRSNNYLAAYTGQITDAVMTTLSGVRFGFFETKIKEEDLKEIESKIRRTIHNIFFIQ